MTRRLLLGLGLLALAGCQRTSIDPMARLLIQPPEAHRIGYAVHWQIHLGLAPGQKIVHFEPLGDRLVVLESGNVLTVLEAGTGKALWRQKIGKSIERFSKPVRHGEMLVICSETRAFIYDIHDGNLLSVFKLAFVANTTPVIAEGYLILGSPSGMVFAHDMNKGLLRWNIQLGSAVSTDPLMAGPSLLVTDSRGDVVAFNPLSGGLLWRSQTWRRITANIRATETVVYVASEDQSLYAYARNTGKQIWRFYTEDPLTSPPVPMGSLVLAQVPRRGLVAVEALRGEQRWALPFEDGQPVLMKGERIYVHRPGRLLLVAPGDGQIVDEVELPRVQRIVADSPSGGNLYFVRLTGPIMKLTPR